VNPKGIILVLAGPSGVGKDAVVDCLRRTSDFVKLPSCTTRPPRPGEIDGVHYHFMDVGTFLSMIESGAVLEYKVMAGQYYGVGLGYLNEARNENRHVVVVASASGAFLLKERFPETALVFLMPPSQAALTKRLLKRGMPQEEIASRFEVDMEAWRSAHLFDFIVVNYDNEEQEAADRILRYVHSERELQVSNITEV